MAVANNLLIQLAELANCCQAPSGALESPVAEQISADLQLLGHPIRLQILTMLRQQNGDVCVCDLEAALPVKQPTVSHHLRLLREAGLIEAERRGQWAYYRIAAEPFGALRQRLAALFELLG